MHHQNTHSRTHKNYFTIECGCFFSDATHRELKTHLHLLLWSIIENIWSSHTVLTRLRRLLTISTLFGCCWERKFLIHTGGLTHTRTPHGLCYGHVSRWRWYCLTASFARNETGSRCALVLVLFTSMKAKKWKYTDGENSNLEKVWARELSSEFNIPSIIYNAESVLCIG